jgi:hypothetical protein
MSSYLKLDTSLDSYISFADAVFPAVGTDSASFAIWCKLNSKSTSMTLFHKHDGATGYKAIFNEEVNGDLSLEFIVDGATTKTSRIENIPTKLDEWQLFVFLIDRTGNQSIYIDAVLHADTYTIGTSPSGTVDNASDFYVGVDLLNPSVSSSGSIDIDGFAFYNGYLLTQSNIRDIYNRGMGVKLEQTTPNLTFGLNIDEGTGTSLTDIVASVLGAINTNDSSLIWDVSGVDVMSPSHIKLYLTSLEPDLAQTNYSQSIGGYISQSLLYPETTLASSVGLYQTSATLVSATGLLGSTDIALRTEIAKVEAITGTTVTIVERGINGSIGYYPSGTVVQGLTLLFNDSFNTGRKQYRCYAIKNISTSETAYDLSIYLKQLSRNSGTTIKLALEYPRSQEITGASTSWTSSMLVDSSIAGVYEDNLFTDSYMTFEDSPNSGERRRINSYDGDTGTFVFADSLPIDFDVLVHNAIINYTVDASPAQRVKSGIDAPIDSDYISEFSTVIDRGNAIELINLDTIGSFLPGDIIYVWVEREIGKSNSSYVDNSFVLSIDFNRDLGGN